MKGKKGKQSNIDQYGWAGVSYLDPEYLRKQAKLPRDLDKKWTELLKRPRVMKAKDTPLTEHEGFKARNFDVTEMGLTALKSIYQEFDPGAFGIKHGHMNEAIFYILEGKGYEIHDGERFDWEAGDVVIIPPGCVHRHVNADPKRKARAIVVNPKATYLFHNLAAQRLVQAAGELPL